MKDLLLAVLDKHYDGKWETFSNTTGTMSDYENIKWVGDAPNKSDFQAKYDAEEQEYNNIQYQRDRLAEYPSIEECIHAILDDDLEALQAKRLAVKAKYPKPE